MVPYEAFVCPCRAGDVVLRESYKPTTHGSSSTPIYSPGSSTPPRYSSGASTTQSYSLGTLRNAECSNCKYLFDKITVLEASNIKTSPLVGNMFMKLLAVIACEYGELRALDGNHITSRMLKAKIKSKVFYSMNDNDAVSLCLVAILRLVLLGFEPRHNVLDWCLRLVNERDAWDLYPWGSYAWMTLYSRLKNANVKHWQPLYANSQEEGDDHPTYSLIGFTWAFKQGIIVLESPDQENHRNVFYDVCKPTTKQLLRLPNPQTWCRTEKVAIIVMGSKTKLQYKIVRLSNPTVTAFQQDDELYSLNCEVFDSTEMAWVLLKALKLPHGVFFASSQAITARGSINMLLNNMMKVGIAWKPSNISWEIWVLTHDQSFKKQHVFSKKEDSQRESLQGLYDSDTSIMVDYNTLIFHRFKRGEKISEFVMCGHPYQIFNSRSDFELVDFGFIPKSYLATSLTAWIRNLLRELHSPLLTTTLVYSDNVGAVYLSANLIQHQRTKHIEIDIHFVRDMVKAGHVWVLHVPSRFPQRSSLSFV
nr:ribonuclease H-like domain-containing protein [Tanacetum cinerariifolium]